MIPKGFKRSQGSQEEEGEGLGKEDAGGNEDASKAQVELFVAGDLLLLDEIT